MFLTLLCGNTTHITNLLTLFQAHKEYADYTGCPSGLKSHIFIEFQLFSEI